GSSSQPLQTSTHAFADENCSNSSNVSSIAEFVLPQAGYTFSNRFNETSRNTSKSFFKPKGQTPPTGCPVCSSTSSGDSMRALNVNVSRNFLLSIFASPAVTTRIA